MKLNREGKSRILSSSELDILITYLPTNKHKLIAETCRRTAGRISEVCQLKYENVTCNSLFFPKGICKGTLKARNVPVSEDYLVKLHQFKEECALNQAIGANHSPLISASTALRGKAAFN